MILRTETSYSTPTLQDQGLVKVAQAEQGSVSLRSHPALLPLHATQHHGTPQAREYRVLLSSSQDTELPSEPEHRAALYFLASHAFETMVTPQHPQPTKILPWSAPRTTLIATSAPSLHLLLTKTKTSPHVPYLVHHSLVGICSFRHPVAAPFAAALVSLAPGFAASWSSTAGLLLLLRGTFEHQRVVL